MGYINPDRMLFYHHSTTWEQPARSGIVFTSTSGKYFGTYFVSFFCFAFIFVRLGVVSHPSGSTHGQRQFPDSQLICIFLQERAARHQSSLLLNSQHQQDETRSAIGQDSLPARTEIPTEGTLFCLPTTLADLLQSGTTPSTRLFSLLQDLHPVGSPRSN